MPKRVNTSTKTTRNKAFNSYTTIDYAYNIVMNTVNSTTATKANPNIKLLDVNEAIIKSGKDIVEDALQNMTMVELSTGLDTTSAKIVAYYAINGRPDPTVNPQGAALYDKLEKILEANELSFEKIEKMVINYTDYTVLEKDSPYYIFGAPEQVVLNNRQHYNNCGIESTLNNLAMAGIIKMKENLKDQGKVEKSFLKTIWERNLANDSHEVGVLNSADGGTFPDDYRDIMEYFGIESEAYYITNKCDEYVYEKNRINELAYKISQGHGAILGVCSDVLWNEVQSETETKTKRIDHAIAITGVVYDTDNIDPENNAGIYVKPVGFYIHDTGAWMTRFISYDDFIDATLCDYLYGDTDTGTTLTSLKEYDSRLDVTIKKEVEGIFVTITDKPIKVNTFNLNVTGDKYANIIWGNNSDNVIKGMKGSDTLYGRGGRDTIRGGVGNDIIVGNEAYKVKVQEGEVTIFDSDTIRDFKAYISNVNVKEKLDNVELNDYGTLTVDEFLNIENKMPTGINTLCGDSGNDIIIGGENADLIYGGTGNDYIWGGYGRNAAYGGAGNDVIIGGYDNDRLFGDAGNDYIYGLDDGDVINGGAGNDHIFGGKGDDIIETGKGNDTVYFEGTGFGQDTIMAKSGNTVFTFVNDDEIDASNASDLFFTLDYDKDNDKVMNLAMQYTLDEIKDDESQIAFNNFFTIKSGKTKALYLDAADGIYNVAVSKKAKAAVLSNSTKVNINGVKVKNSNMNHVLLTTYNGATITTSNKNDIVTMVENGSTAISTKVDKITYTAGKDKYVSEDRNTNYTVGAIGENTNLSIYDNVIGLEKIEIDIAEYKNAIANDPNTKIEDYTTEYKNYTSKNDKLYTTSEQGSFNLFFDIGIGENEYLGYTTKNGGFYLLNSADEIIFTNIANGNEIDGYIYMDSFFGYDNQHNTGYEFTNPTEESTFYGNGQIEHIFCNNEEFEYTGDLIALASDVAQWLNGYNTAHAGDEGFTPFDSAFDAFKNGDQAVITALTNLYIEA